jgi:RNA polymerase sigma factor (TIGR02999 family)
LVAGKTATAIPNRIAKIIVLFIAFLLFSKDLQGRTRDRRHFFAVSARLMRRVLVDHARARATAKRGGAAVHVTLDAEAANPRPDLLSDLLALDQSLHRLSEIDPRKGRIIELRYFGGLTVDEVAEVLGVSAPTVALESRMARAWLAARNRQRPMAPRRPPAPRRPGSAPPPPRGSAA